MSVEGSFLLESMGFDCFRHVATPRCLATRKCARCDRSSPADPRPWGARPLVVPWSVEGALLRRAPRVQVPPMAVGDGYRSRTPGTRIERGGTLMPRAHLLPVPWPLEGALFRRAVRVRVPPMAVGDGYRSRTPGTRIERGGALMPRAHLLPVPWPLEGALLRRAVRVRVPPMAGVDEQQMRAR